MLKKAFVMLAVIIVVVYGCKNLSEEQEASPENVQPEVVTEIVATDADKEKYIEQLENDKHGLLTEINSLKAELASAQGTIDNMDSEIERISETNHNLIYLLSN